MKNKIRFALLFAFGLVASLIPLSVTAQSVEDAVTQADDFVIGQHYGGGIIFWIDDSGQHGFIAAESDQGFNWWGDRFYLVTGATSTAVGTGKINTRKIVRVQGRRVHLRGTSYAPTIGEADLRIGSCHPKMNSICFISRRTWLGALLEAPIGVRPSLRSITPLPGPNFSTMTTKSSLIRTALTGCVRFARFRNMPPAESETLNGERTL